MSRDPSVECSIQFSISISTIWINPTICRPTLNERLFNPKLSKVSYLLQMNNSEPIPIIHHPLPDSDDHYYSVSYDVYECVKKYFSLISLLCVAILAGRREAIL